MRIFPILCASALHNIGSDWLLDFIVETFPSPADHAAGSRLRSTARKCTARSATRSPRPPSSSRPRPIPSPDASLSSRSCPGCIKNDQHLYRRAEVTEESLAHIGSPLGKTIQPVNELHAGDIGAVAKLKDTLTGHTLADKSSLIEFEPVHVPEPSIAFAVEAKSRAGRRPHG